jgi:hypothetical protein
MIRKLPGTEVTSLIPQDIKALLIKLQQWCMCNYMVKRDVGAIVVNEDTIAPVVIWIDSLDMTGAAKDLAKFTDSCDKKNWLADIAAFLEQQKGASGMPLSYVVRGEDEPGPDEGFGCPTFGKEMRLRGRHDGMFG